MRIEIPLHIGAEEDFYGTLNYDEFWLCEVITRKYFSIPRHITSPILILSDRKFAESYKLTRGDESWTASCMIHTKTREESLYFAFVAGRLLLSLLKEHETIYAGFEYEP